MTDYLDLGDLEYLIARVLGEQPQSHVRQSQVRDWGLLESALHRPQSSVFGTDAYPTLDEKAAALMHSLVRNHPLADGNKRLGWLATRLFYARNGGDLRAESPQLADALVRRVATGEHDVAALAVLLRKWVHDLGD